MFKLGVKIHYGNNISNSTSSGKTIDWIMSEKHEQITDSDLFYCFINIQKESNLFKFFIVPNVVVSTYVSVEHRYWLGVKGNKVKDNPMRMFRLGLDNSEYEIDTPLASIYEDNWEFNINLEKISN